MQASGDGEPVDILQQETGNCEHAGDTSAAAAAAAAAGVKGATVSGPDVQSAASAGDAADVADATQEIGSTPDEGCCVLLSEVYIMPHSLKSQFMLHAQKGCAALRL